MHLSASQAMQVRDHLLLGSRNHCSCRMQQVLGLCEVARVTERGRETGRVVRPVVILELWSWISLSCTSTPGLSATSYIQVHMSFSSPAGMRTLGIPSAAACRARVRPQYSVANGPLPRPCSTWAL